MAQSGTEHLDVGLGEDWLGIEGVEQAGSEDDDRLELGTPHDWDAEEADSELGKTESGTPPPAKGDTTGKVGTLPVGTPPAVDYLDPNLSEEQRLARLRELVATPEGAAEVLKRGLLQSDYTRKRQADTERVRELEAKLNAQQEVLARVAGVQPPQPITDELPPADVVKDAAKYDVWHQKVRGRPATQADWTADLVKQEVQEVMRTKVEPVTGQVLTMVQQTNLGKLVDELDALSALHGNRITPEVKEAIAKAVSAEVGDGVYWPGMAQKAYMLIYGQDELTQTRRERDEALARAGQATTPTPPLAPGKPGVEPGEAYTSNIDSIATRLKHKFAR